MKVGDVIDWGQKKMSGHWLVERPEKRGDQDGFVITRKHDPFDTTWIPTNEQVIVLPGEGGQSSLYTGATPGL